MDGLIRELDEISAKLATGEITAFKGYHGPLVIKQGKGKVEKQTDMLRISLDYKITKVD